MSLEENVANRRRVVAALRAEIVGPDPHGQALASLPDTLSKEAARDYAAVTQADGEEVLVTGQPSFRYGAGILNPPAVDEDDPAENDVMLSDDVETSSNNAITSKAQSQARRKGYDAQDDDFGISATNSFKPSAMGLSFVVDTNAISAPLLVEIADGQRHAGDEIEFRHSGFYVPSVVKVENGDSPPLERTWWARRKLCTADGGCPKVELSNADLAQSGRVEVGGTGFPGRLRLNWHVRSWPEAPAGHRLVTISLQNLGGSGGADVLSLFQSGLTVTLPRSALLPYPSSLVPADSEDDPLDEDRVNRLLYRRRKVYAVGHGCATDWQLGEESAQLWSDVMPLFEMAPMDFEVSRADGTKLDLSMRALGRIDGCRTEAQTDESLEEVIVLYEAWIDGLDHLDAPELQETAEALKQRCRDAAARMREGLRILRENPKARTAFELANEAMLMTQHRRPTSARTPQIKDNKASWPIGYESLQLNDPSIIQKENDETRPLGRWRPFQLAFLLMSLDGIVEEDSRDREIVDLIWFPTGGGKTEAYLGLTAFTVFYNALTKRGSPKDGHPRAVSVLMRYTLRLLTAQQFQRAVTLFCAMELLRRKRPDMLGESRFTVGLWVGDSTTPNKVEKAQRAIRLLEGENLQLQEGEERDANPFVLLQCPWCSAAFGRVAELPKNRYVVHGYATKGAGNDVRMVFVCPDRNCEFSSGHDCLPAVVVDDNVYRRPPSLLIGTVDKFAMLAWKPNARSLFGLADDGSRVARGPELIIQDELHLMTGPLGTMVGLFETAVDWLCRADGGRPPKIIASTATASRAGEQVRALYARREMRVFPPPGLVAEDSFFAREDATRRGRLYVGVLAPGHGSMQTTQRHAYAAMMQAAADIAWGADPDRAAELADPWWTVLAYYNSLRELGGALTLFGADVPDQLEVIAKRRARSPLSMRQVHVDGRVMELTSRISSGDVPESLRSMEKPVDGFALTSDKQKTVWLKRDSGVQDACLASNIIEVGVDVPRLSLMTIVGQPKTSSSYIQASSRVGRKEDRPGLVVMLYSNTKPRDRSHYERFRSYHQSIYAWVEPTSVTPFSPPAVTRALHAVVIALARQLSKEAAVPSDVIQHAKLFEQIGEVLAARVDIVGRPDEGIEVGRRLQEIIRKWRAYDPTLWSWAGWGTPPQDPPLINASGKAYPPSWTGRFWETPQSLRAVDTSCEAAITTYYVDQKASEEQS